MKKYAVIGNPISQSWSPFIHQQFAKQTHIDLSYEALKVDCTTSTDFRRILEQLFIQGYSGLNITLPYKVLAFESIQEKNGLSRRAEKSGAVNTVTFINQDRWTGDNTDGPGVLRDLKNNLGWPLKGINILILGAGGAARGAISALADEKPACIHILNRDPLKAKNLAKKFSGYSCEISSIPLGSQTVKLGAEFTRDLNDSELENSKEYSLYFQGFPTQNHLKIDVKSDAKLRSLRSERYINPPLKLTYQLIINATSSSLWQQLPATIQYVDAKNAYGYDMVYAALPTLFLSWMAEKQAKATSDGLGMLVEQAAESFYQWHEVMPETRPVIQLLRHHL